MQRVSSFLPSWDKRNSANSNGKPTSFFGWSHKSTPSTTSNGGVANRNSAAVAKANGLVNPSAAALARINVAAANNNVSQAVARFQREAFWPATLDLECDKAARILKTFCSDGYLAPVDSDTEDADTSAEPKSPAKTTKKIPKRIIQNAAGIAVFTCMRNGLWMTGSGGSGIMIARKSDGTWSPPSGIMLHTPTLSFIIGVDVYDCVLVVNDVVALEAITRPRVTLGEDIELTRGPCVNLDSNEQDLRLSNFGNTVLTYMKSRGQHQEVNLNGCLLTERTNENERFYSSNVTQMDILAGNVGRHVEETGPLFEVIKMAEGRTDFDSTIIAKTASQPAPGDATIATPKSTPASPRPAFGIPKADDPDPFGLLALEMAGMEIREAGTQLRPTSSQFDSSQHPMSPSLSKFSRQSMDTFITKSNRGSYMSTKTTKSQMTDAGTQTNTGKTPETTPSPSRSDDGLERSSIDRIAESREEDEPEEIDYTKVDLTPLKHLSHEYAVGQPASDNAAKIQQSGAKMLDPSVAGRDVDSASKASSNYEVSIKDESDEDGDDDIDETDGEEDYDDEDEPVVFEVAAVQPARTQAVASRVIHAKGSMVNIPKRLPPPLPTRSPARNSRLSKGETAGETAAAATPLRQTFSEADLNGDDNPDTPKPLEVPSASKSDGGEADDETELVKEDMPEHTESDKGNSAVEEPTSPDEHAHKTEIEQPSVEASTVDDSAVEEQPVEETTLKLPAVEEPAVEEPAVEEPAVEEPTVEEPTVEESIVEEPTVEEPTVEEPTVEESIVEEKSVENEAVEEALVDESALKEMAIKEEAIDKPAVDESAVDESAAEKKAVKEEGFEEPAVKGESVKGEVVENPAAGDLTGEDTTIAEQAVEDAASNEPRVEETVNTENDQEDVDTPIAEQAANQQLPVADIEEVDLGAEDSDAESEPDSFGLEHIASSISNMAGSQANTAARSSSTETERQDSQDTVTAAATESKTHEDPGSETEAQESQIVSQAERIREQDVETEQPVENKTPREQNGPDITESRVDAAALDTESMEDSATQDTTTDDSSVGETVDDAQSPRTVQTEQTDHSDSASTRKHTSSIFTGANEDRWSLDRSSLTTPTSERAFSMTEDVASDGTPKKTAAAQESSEGSEIQPSTTATGLKSPEPVSVA